MGSEAREAVSMERAAERRDQSRRDGRPSFMRCAALAVFGQLTDDCGGRGQEKKHTRLRMASSPRRPRPHGPGWLNAVISDGRLDARVSAFSFPPFLPLHTDQRRSPRHLLGKKARQGGTWRGPLFSRSASQRARSHRKPCPCVRGDPPVWVDATLASVSRSGRDLWRPAARASTSKNGNCLA